jgi:hypothetical protein
MKPITNRTKRVDSKNCTFSEIEAGNKARKVANRRDSRKEIQNLIDEDESIFQENNDFFESDGYYENLENELMNNEFNLDSRYKGIQYFREEEKDADNHPFYEPCPCCGL